MRLRHIRHQPAMPLLHCDNASRSIEGFGSLHQVRCLLIMPVFSKVPLTPEDTVTFVVNVLASVLQLVLRFCDLLLGLPIVAGQYVLCHLPSPHGEVYAAAGINHAQVIGRNGGFAIAGIAWP